MHPAMNTPDCPIAAAPARTDAAIRASVPIRGRLAARCAGLLCFFAALAAIPVTPAFAQDVTITLAGEVAPVCGLRDDTGAPVAIDFGLLSDIDVGQQSPEVTHELAVICNDPDGGTLTIESENDGNLRRGGSAGGEGNDIGYTIAATGDPGLAVSPTGLATRVNRTFLSSPDFFDGKPITLSFRANGVRRDSPAGNGGSTTTVFAGIYRDVVRVSVTAN